MLHAQLTMMPEPLIRVDSSIPQALSSLVQMLLAKYPDDRYQSSFGLLHDLTHIAGAWSKGLIGEKFVREKMTRPSAFVCHDVR